MSLKENLIKKIEIKKMARKVISSLKPREDGYHRIDKDTMQRLLSMTAYTHQRERDLDLYIQKSSEGTQKILVLDNGLAIFDTDIQDVVLRKSPTVKEIISIRNIKKILNDSDVVICKKEESVERIKNECINSLDLSFSEKDLDQIVKDGVSSLKNNYSDGVIESISLFAELLDYVPAPDPLKVKHHAIYGKLERKTVNLSVFGPMIIFSKVNNELKLLDSRISTSDKAKIKNIHRVAGGEAKADATGPDVLEFLKTETLK